ncbi:MAG: DUF72 domain-containing protein [Flavobacteriales bacterium]|nr:DUF72 domain-containing protein [Flavobacteriales bacterium]
MKFGKVDSIEGIDFRLPKTDQRSIDVLSNYKKTTKPEIRIGCSIWSNKDYVGSVYPEKTPQSKFLAAYCAQFNSVEVNATRYGMPKQTTLEGWKIKAPDGFKYSFKVPAPVTNRKDLNDPEGVARMDQFAAGMHLMGNRIGTSFIMMPQHFGLDKMDQLSTFLNNWPRELNAALELREENIIHDKRVRQLLEESKMSLCVTDTPGRRDLMHNYITNEELYVRFVGTMDKQVNDERVAAWAERTCRLIDAGLQRVYFMIHQPAENRGSSIDVAQQFGEFIQDYLPQATLQIPVNYRQATLF